MKIAKHINLVRKRYVCLRVWTINQSHFLCLAQEVTGKWLPKERGTQKRKEKKGEKGNDGDALGQRQDCYMVWMNSDMIRIHGVVSI